MKYLLVFLPVLTLLFSVQVAAQTPAPITGLQVIAERQYAMDPSAPLAADDKGVALATVRAYLFDSENNANATWETLVAADAVQRDLPKNDDSIQYEQVELNDIGDRAMVLNLTTTRDDGSTGIFRTVIVQKNATLISVTVIAGSLDAATTADAIATAMSNRTADLSPAVYDGTGKSHGGVWSMFLPENAKELGGLQVYADKETRPRT